MAGTRLAVTPLLPGGIALGLTLGTAAVAVLALLAATGGIGTTALDAYTLRVVAFTVMQATLSTLCAVVPGIVVARALAQRPIFPGRRLLLRLFGLPLVLPVIVAIFGIAAIFGSNGAIAQLSRWLGGPDWSFPYGLVGILIAHTFFNLPLVVRLLLPALESIPGETWRLATQLGMSGWQAFRRIELPVVREVVPGIAGIVFLLCFTSFAVVLTFGGGPQATTIEVAIYHALRLEFDISRAVGLAVLQIAICVTAVAIGYGFFQPVTLASTEGRNYPRPGTDRLCGRVLDSAAIGAAAVLVFGPLAAIILRGVTGPVLTVVGSTEFQLAVIRTVVVGTVAGGLSLTLGWALLLTTRELRRHRQRPLLAGALENISAVNLVVSPVILSAGLFVLLLPLGLVFDNALLLAALVNAIVMVPFVVRTLGPHLDRVAERYDRACAALGVRQWNRFRVIEWPIVRPAVGRALALATGLSLGDLTAIALFGSESSVTLPLYLYRLMSAYRMAEASVAALVLTLLCLGVFVVIERAVGGHHARP